MNYNIQRKDGNKKVIGKKKEKKGIDIDSDIISDKQEEKINTDFEISLGKKKKPQITALTKRPENNEKIRKILLKKPKILSQGNKIKSIYQIADIHVENKTDRYEEYEYVFNNLKNEIKKDKDDALIILCGDIFDSNEPTIQAISMTSKLLKGLSNICPVILMHGNHDIYEKFPEKKTGLDLIFEMNTSKNLFLLRETGLYQYNDWMISHTSPYDDIVIPAELIKTNLKKLCLYHGQVKVKSYDYSIYPGSNKFYYAKNFSGYDLSLFGDIHTHDFLDKEKTMAYSSSLIQQDFGEDLYNHGMIKWILTNDIPVGKFIKIKNNHGMVKILLKDNKIDKSYDIKNLPDNIKVSIEHMNCTNTYIDSIISFLKKKYNVISLENKYGTDKKNILNRIKTKTLDINTIIRDYIKEQHSHNAEEKLLEEAMITEFHEMMKQITIPKYNYGEIKFKKLKFKNTFSYGPDNEIDFTSKGNIVSIKGLNGSGKSSIIEILVFVLFVGGLRVKSMKKNILNVMKSDYDISLELEIGKKKYLINRKYFCDKDEPNDDSIFIYDKGAHLTKICDGVINCKKQIKELFNGMSITNFIFGCFMPQYRMNDILELTTCERINLLSYFFELDYISSINSLAKQKLKLLESKLAENKTKLKMSNYLIDELQMKGILPQMSDSDGIQQKLSKKIKSIMDKYKELETKKKEYIYEIKKNPSNEHISKFEKYIISMQELMSNGKFFNNKLDEEKKKSDQYKLLKKLMEEKQLYDIEIKKLTKEIFNGKIFVTMTSNDGIIASSLSYYINDIDNIMNTLLLDFDLKTKISLSNIIDDDADDSINDYITPLNKVMNQTKKKKCEIKINKIDTHTGFLSESCGKFEQFMINLSFKIAISMLTKKQLPSILFIDEALSCINTDKSYNIRKLFQLLSENYEKIYIITHNNTIHKYSNYLIKIEKNNNISRITYNNNI